MARQGELRVLVATDGSSHARAAVVATLHFPWPERTRVRAISAREAGAEHRPSIRRAARDRGAEQAVDRARRTLSRRWPAVEAAVVDEAPVEGILGEAKRFRADVIVVGWRGHGAVRRLLMGSVSRGVVRGSTCPVLVVRQSQRVRRIVVGFDGSEPARRGVAFAGRLAPPRDGRVTLVTAVELMPVPSPRLVSAAATREVKRANTATSRAAMRALNRAAAALERSGWRTQTRLVHGEPLRDLLDEVADTRADLLIVGATGTSGVPNLPLGSVAEGALNRCPVPVLVAR